MAKAGEISESLDLFKKPQTSCGIASVQYQDFRPVGSISGDNPIEFNLSNVTQYMDLSRSFLYLKTRILKNGVPIDDTNDDVAPENLFLHCLFKQVDMTVNHSLLFNTGSNYHLLSMLQILMNGDSEDKSLTSELYYKDGSTLLDANKAGDGSFGYNSRREWCKNGQYWEMQGVLRSPLCQMPRLIPNGVSIGIKLYKNAPEVCLQSNDVFANAYSVEISEAVYRLCTVTPDPEVLAAHTQILREGRSIHLPLMKPEIQTHVVSKGSSRWASADLFHGRVPTLMTICMLSSSRYQGSFPKSCYFFEDYGVRDVVVYKDGQSFPKNSTKCDFANGFAVDAYRMLMTSTQAQIEYNEYVKGYTMFAFDMSGSFGDCGSVGTGNVTAYMDFAAPVTENITVVVFAQFPGCLEIDNNRRVTLK